MAQDLFTVWILIPSLIFLARILDVSLGTIKIIFIAKGYRKSAPILAFFEMLLWLYTITKIMENLTNPINYVAYALGFSAGTYAGIILEGKLAVGTEIIQVITKKDATNLVQYLKDHGYRVTHVTACGEEGPVNILFTVVKRKKISQVVGIIRRFNPKSFYTIEDIEYVSERPAPFEYTREDQINDMFKGLRKSK
ncbi:MAG: DUF2179 domain-containing protein [Candidatus Altiarchaeales archaeon]|nr:DUF2179 domain-containing protein [Candidatus Altiarchaeales archaeon]